MFEEKLKHLCIFIEEGALSQAEPYAYLLSW